MKKEKKLVKYHKWTEARRRCFYRIEDAREEVAPNLYEYRGLALRKSPMVRYLQGLFAILFCYTCAAKEPLLGNVILDTFVAKSVVSMLILLFGYRLSQMARDNETDIYDKRFRRKIFYPLLVSRGLPLLFAYITYFMASVLLGKFHATSRNFLRMFFEGAFGEVILVGMLVLEFLVIFPFLWRFLYSHDKQQVNLRAWVLVTLYFCYEVIAGLGMVPAEVHHFFFGRYLLSFLLGMMLFIRRRHSFHVWETLLSGGVGILFPVGTYLLCSFVPQFQRWIDTFRDLPFSAGVGTLFLFAMVTPLLTHLRYFRLVEPSHSVVTLPGKAYYNILMCTAVVLGLELEISIRGIVIEPQSVFITAFCILLGILWHLLMRTKAWKHFVGGFWKSEKGMIHFVFKVRKIIIVKINRLMIRYYDKRLKVGDEE